MTNEKMYFTATEVAQMLGVSSGTAYRIIRRMNDHLKSKGFLTIPGKVPVEYFREKWYGGTKQEMMR